MLEENGPLFRLCETKKTFLGCLGENGAGGGAQSEAYKPKDTIRDGGSTALYTVDTIDTVDMVYAVDMVNTVDRVYTVDMVYTVDTVDTAS